MIRPVDPPTLSLEVDDLVDWLELTALFDEFGVARLDALLGALKELEDEAEGNIGERDRAREVQFAAIEAEVDERCRALGPAYPFRLSDSAEELALVDPWRGPQAAPYLVCLIATHVTGSEILGRPPHGELLTRLRNRIFQMIATFGMAGASRGPAYSVGWPRESNESIVRLLERAAANGGGFTARNPPGQFVSPDEKDGGVDVIAWTAEAQPPPSVFFFAQSASGKNWPGKPVSAHAELFREAYMLDHMAGNRGFMTVIPYRVMDSRFWHSQHRLHHGILDRLRLPLRAWEGLQLAAQGVHVDDSANVDDVVRWLDDYMVQAQAA